MFGFAPMPLLDDFLIQYDFGQAVLLLFVLSLPAGYVMKSWKITGINTILFGVLFIIVPSIGGGPVFYGFLGIALLVLGPMIYVSGDR